MKGLPQFRLRVRPQTHQPQRIGIGLLADPYPIGFDRAVAMILPAPRQRVITVARPQRAIVDQRDQSGVQPAIEPRPGAALSSPACSPA